MKQRLLFAIKDERGGARLKFIVAIVIFAAVVYTGYVYIPVAY